MTKNSRETLKSLCDLEILLLDCLLRMAQESQLNYFTQESEEDFAGKYNDKVPGTPPHVHDPAYLIFTVGGIPIDESGKNQAIRISR